MLDSADAHLLADFYQRLLGGSYGKDETDWVTLGPANDGMTRFCDRTRFRATGLAEQSHRQQMMVHLDFEVDDLDGAEAHAIAAGASLASYQPQELVSVMIDPAGHPFCLWVEGKASMSAMR